jgi:hypothetical protein
MRPKTLRPFHIGDHVCMVGGVFFYTHFCPANPPDVQMRHICQTVPRIYFRFFCSSPEVPNAQAPVEPNTGRHFDDRAHDSLRSTSDDIGIK